MNPASADPPRLLRALGPLMALAVVVGTVIGSGVFKKPQQVAENVPYFGLAALVWILGGVLALLGALSLAEVSVLYPRAGGNYVFLREGYGRLAGFLWGWVEFWMIRGASLAALAAVFAESLHDVLRNDAFRRWLGLEPAIQVLGFWEQQALTVAVILGLALVNVRGVKWGGLLQLFITVVKVGSLLAILVLPFVASRLASPVAAVPSPEPANLVPWWPDSWGENVFAGLGSGMLAVLWAYHGWMNIAPVAEEVRDPQRTLPIAFLGGVGIVIFLYLGANLAYYLILPQPEIAQMKASPVATVFAQRLLGPIGAAIASAAVMCSVFGALNGNLLVGPRVLYAMGEDGLAPRALGAIHPRWHTPALAIVVLAIWSCLLVIGTALWSQLSPGKPLFDILTDFAMFGATIFETSAVATIFVFRRRFPNAERPYRCWGYPVVPAVYVAILAVVVMHRFIYQPDEALVGIGFIGLGGVVYYLIREKGQASGISDPGLHYQGH